MRRRPINLAQMSIGSTMPVAAQVGGQQAMGNPNTGQPAHVSRQKSDTRFRSFAERWMVARAHMLTADPAFLAEDTWRAIMDAKRAYNMIRSAGENIEPDEGMFYVSGPRR